jgi:DNA-binding transcriptional regulator YhcF (GntR family)
MKRVPSAWRDEVARSRLGPTVRAVACALATYMSASGVCWPSVETLAELLRLDRRTVQRSIRTLEAHGLLVVERGGGRGKTSIYRAALSAAVSERKGRQSKHKRAAEDAVKGGTRAARSIEVKEERPRGRLSGAARPLDQCMGPCGEVRPLWPFSGRLMCVECVLAETGDLEAEFRAHIAQLRAKSGA